MQRKLNHGNYDWLPGYFKDQDVIVCASGPSVSEIDIDRVNRGHAKRIVTSFGIEHFTPDIMTAIDGGTMPKLVEILRRKYGVKDFDQAPFKSLMSWSMPYEPGGQIAIIRAQSQSEVISIKPPNMYSRIATGALALSAALCGDAKRIFLLGCDCAPKGDKENYFDTLKLKGNRTISEARGYNKLMLKSFEKFSAWDYKIYNVSEISLIKAFKKLTPDQFYEMVGI